MGWAPISTAKVSDIRLEIDEQIKHGWIPDVIVIDYADILAPETGTSGLDFRHQTNETWKALRRLSQDYHCLVITATQSDARSYDGKLLTMSNFSEDKRKLSHVTGVVGLNQSPEEKKNGIYRLNWVVLREGVYLEQNCITVAGCLGIANPAMISTW
jgi:replicative DNA helicase